jgi:hypothetical protein
MLEDFEAPLERVVECTTDLLAGLVHGRVKAQRDGRRK